MRPSFTLSAVVRSALALGTRAAVRTLGGSGRPGRAGGCARASTCPRSCGRCWPSAAGRRCGPWAATRATRARRQVAPELYLVRGRAVGAGPRHPAGGADLGRRPGRPGAAGRGGWMRPSFTLSAVVRSALASAPGRRCGPWAATRATRARRQVAPELHLVRGRAVGAGPRHPAGGADLGRRPGRPGAAGSGGWMRPSFTLSAVVRSALASAPGRRCGPWAAAQGDQGGRVRPSFTLSRVVAVPRRWAMGGTRAAGAGGPPPSPPPPTPPPRPPPPLYTRSTGKILKTSKACSLMG
jgi:hypothetical protein